MECAVVKAAAPPLSVAGTLGALRRPTARDLVFSLNAYVAAALALLIGFSQNLDNPYWAVLSIYIVLSPPESGAIRSKALFRLIGTALGGALSLVVGALFADNVGALLVGTLAVLTALVYLRGLIRTPVNYVWFSAGLTAGVIGITNLQQPLNFFQTAATRVAEIGLGVLLIAAVDSIVWPRVLTPDFLSTLSAWRHRAREWMDAALGDEITQASPAERQTVMHDQLRELTRAVDVIDAKAIQLAYDVVPLPPRGRDIDLVRQQLVQLVADLAAIHGWTAAFRALPGGHDEMEAVLAEIAAWTREGDGLAIEAIARHVAKGDALIARLDAHREARIASVNDDVVLERGFARRLSEYVRHTADLRLALHAVETRSGLGPRLEYAPRVRAVRHIDYVVVAIDVLPLVLATGFTSVLWYLTAWDGGPSAILFAFIGCVFLIGQPATLRSAIGLICWISIAFMLVFIYQFAVLPRVTTFPTLMLVFGITLLPLGLLITMAQAGTLITVFTFAFLGLQDVYTGDFERSLMTLGGTMAGLLIATASLYGCSYDRPRLVAQRLLKAVRRDVADAAQARRTPDLQRFLLLTVDRLSRLIPAADTLPADDPLTRFSLVADLRVGANVLILRDEERRVPGPVRAVIKQLRTAVAVSYRHSARRLDRPVGLTEPVEVATRAVAANHDPTFDPAVKAHVLEALIGLRLALAQRPRQRPPQKPPQQPLK